MFVVTLDQNDITWLAFAAGISVGSGNEAAATSLYGIISRITPMEDQGTDALVADSPPAGVASEDFGGTVDPNFMPAPPTPPSRPQTEFGPGRGQGGVTGTPLT